MIDLPTNHENLVKITHEIRCEALFILRDWVLGKIFSFVPQHSTSPPMGMKFGVNESQSTETILISLDRERFVVLRLHSTSSLRP